VKEQAKLIGLGLVAGGAVRGEVVFPRLDMVLGLAARNRAAHRALST
jgi:hypothetical protein